MLFHTSRQGDGLAAGDLWSASEDDEKDNNLALSWFTQTSSMLV